jgi:2-polyprenyl-6-methoxyphenol hydroxylase-like FAD-dependent oxidoreductase
MSTDYDVVTVGGGLGGSALAKILAEHGARVLVVERERQFSDRIRGEWIAPWGVAEARRIGIYDTLIERCGHEEPFFDSPGLGPVRDFRTTTPQQLPALTFHHPAMQEALLDAARRAGAEIRRATVVREVRPGAPPAVMFEWDGRTEEIKARLAVCADGRSSMGRHWAGLMTNRSRRKLLGAGQLFENITTSEDTFTFLINSELRRVAILLPVGRGLVRAYLMYSASQIDRLQGAGDVARLIHECVKTGIPAQCYAAACPIGPLASFDLTEAWVDHPYREGIVLIGDAAGASDPTWGQGLSLTIRDVRELSEHLIAGDDWDLAAHRYAEAHDLYFQINLRVDGWNFDLFLGEGPDADRLRARAFPLLAAEPERIPDHGFSGLDLPADEQVRRRFFGEA